jgi:hypothetical protein
MNESIFSTPDVIFFQKSWRVFLIEHNAAKNYHLSNLLYMGSTKRNPLLDQLLPSLLFLRAVSLLDDGLKLYIQFKDIPMPRRQYRDSLEGRISVLSDAAVINNADILHCIRKQRNEIAHELELITNWDQLLHYLDLIEASLQKLDLIGCRPHLEYFGERSEMRWVDDPEVLGVRDFRCGVKENGKTAMEFSWTETLSRLSNSKAEAK